MKAIRIIFILSLVTVASAAYIWFRPSRETPPSTKPDAKPGEEQAVSPPTNATPVVANEPVQPLEERGDAMLFEIDALQNTPFDEAIVAPFD